MKTLLTILLWILGIGFVLAVLFGVNVLITKGIILVALELFKVDWRGKFWAVFIALSIIQSIVGCARSKSK